MIILRHICDPYLAAGEVGVFGQFSVESLEENLIRDFTNVHTGFVQHREDAFMLLLHQIHDDLVIEEVDLQPEHRHTDEHEPKITSLQGDLIRGSGGQKHHY